jgi:transcriptional regulator with XRE-family HTH domain
LRFQIDTKTIGERLRLARMIHGYTIPEVAGMTGISRGNLSSLENDRNRPSAPNLTRLCEVYSVSADWILKGERAGPAFLLLPVLSVGRRGDLEGCRLAVRLLLSTELPRRAYALEGPGTCGFLFVRRPGRYLIVRDGFALHGKAFGEVLAWCVSLGLPVASVQPSRGAFERLMTRQVDPKEIFQILSEFRPSYARGMQLYEDYRSRHRSLKTLEFPAPPQAFEEGGEYLAEEAIDPELLAMIAYLRRLWEEADPDLRGWIRVQFRRAFPEFQGARETSAREGIRPENQESDFPR